MIKLCSCDSLPLSSSSIVSHCRHRLPLPLIVIGCQQLTAVTADCRLLITVAGRRASLPSVTGNRPQPPPSPSPTAVVVVIDDCRLSIVTCGKFFIFFLLLILFPPFSFFREFLSFLFPFYRENSFLS